MYVLRRGGDGVIIAAILIEVTDINLLTQLLFYWKKRLLFVPQQPALTLRPRIRRSNVKYSAQVAAAFCHST